MKRVAIFHYFMLCSLALVGIVVLSGSVPKADAQTPNIASIAAIPPAEKRVTIIVLDMSSLMKTNDPDGLRCSATNAYIDLSGPGDLIGVVGLDNNKGDRGGPHNFQKSFVWSQPLPMDTRRERQSLEDIVAQKSNKCGYDGSTPIYDALNQALAMLTSNASGGNIAGSVILLTGGSLTSDTSNQIDAVKSELLPQFKKYNWLIHTIALGPINTGYHSFLSDLSNATSGKFYDDGNGVVPGVSPLNITQFFVDIFARQNGRVLVPDIGPMQLNGSFSTDFAVGDFVDHLDVLVVKERGVASVTLTPPPEAKLFPQVVQPASADAHYAIFSVSEPPAGDWQMNAQGTGQFLMDSLILSSVTVTIISPAAQTSVLPLGEKFTIRANIKHGGNYIGGLTVTATIDHVGSSTDGSGLLPLEVELSDSANSGTYQAQVILPPTDLSGSYEISVSAHGLTQTNIASARRTIRLERFPLPYFSSTQANRTQDGIINYTFDQLDPVLQTFESFSIIRSNQWPLQIPFAPLSVSLPCHIELNGRLYPDATMSVVVKSVDSDNTTISVRVVNDGGGFFHIILPPQTAAGIYSVSFSLSGSFHDSYGDLGTIVRTIRLIRPVSWGLDILGWLLILPYPLCLGLVICFLFIRYFRVRGPSGSCIEIGQNGEVVESYKLGQTDINFFKWLFWHHTLDSKGIRPQKGDNGTPLPGGLRFRFRPKSVIEVKPIGEAGKNWSSLSEKKLSPKKFQQIHKLSFEFTDKDRKLKVYTFIIYPL